MTDTNLATRAPWTADTGALVVQAFGTGVVLGGCVGVAVGAML